MSVVGRIKTQLQLVVNHPTARTVVGFAGSNFLVAVISGISGIIYAWWITPSQLGEFNKYTILTGYLGIGFILIGGAFNRHYPYYIGKGDLVEAKKIASVSEWWHIKYSQLCTILFLLLALISTIKGDLFAMLCWMVQIPIIWFSIYGQHLQILYRSNSDFRKLGNIQLSTSIISFVLLILVKFFNIWGFAIRSALQYIVNLYILIKRSPNKIKPYADFREIVQLAKVSIPISLPYYINNNLIKSSISLLIITYLDAKNLGIYVMAMTLQGFFMIFSKSIHQIFTTKLIIKFGETNQNFRKCISLSQKPVLLNVGLTSLVALFVTLFISPLVHLLIPKYIEVIPLIKITIWQVPLFATAMPFILFEAALWLKEIILLKLVKFTTICLLILSFPKDIIFISWSLLLADVIYYFGGYLIIYFKIYRKNAC